MPHTLFTDGGSRGNPGASAIAMVLYDSNNQILIQESKFIGVGTNNNAEYLALILGLETVLQYKSQFVVKNLLIKMDSELVVKQINGQYKIKDLNLQLLASKVKMLTKQFERVTLVHVPRAQNKLADKLVNQELDAQSSLKN